MQESSSKEPVSQSHSSITTKTDSLVGSSGVRAATQKKSQLQKALGEFSRDGDSKAAQKKSLLSDEDTVLHVGNEKRGTIIKDTKRKRWSFTSAVKNSFGGWLHDEKNKVESTFKKPIPKKIVESSSTRTEVIKKAAHMGAVAGTDSLKRTVIKKPIPTSTRSSIRIKPKDVPKEIGDTKPRWTHVIEEDDAEEVVSHKKPVNVETVKPSTPNQAPPQLLEAPDTQFLIPDHVGVVKKESIKKEYRTPRVSQVVTFAQPAPTAPRVPVMEKVVEAAEVPEVKTNDNLETEVPTPKVLENNIKKEPEVIVAPKPKTESVTTDKDVPTAPPNINSQTTVLAGTPTLPISTVIMVIMFIAIIAISTLSWNTIENRNSDDNQVAETVSSIDLIQADKTTLVTNDTGSIDSTIVDAIHSNTGFTKFAITPSDYLVKKVLSWNNSFKLGVTHVEMGALGNNPFFAIDTDSKEVGLVAMFLFETNIPMELRGVYEITNESRFSSAKIDTYDVRLLSDKTTSNLVYFVRSDGLILIAKNKDDLMALIDRAK